MADLEIRCCVRCGSQKIKVLNFGPVVRVDVEKETKPVTTMFFEFKCEDCNLVTRIVGSKIND